ncbi:MAG TPA: EamA family transporter [Sphingomonadales bacterium]|nr:EamA family transporter [Sphingomonadales bacterium]
MTIVKFFQILLVVLGIAGGQVLFKMSGQQITGGGFLKAFLNPYFFSALLVYGVCTVLWVYLLRDVPLGRAYPAVSLTFLIVPLLAWALLGEPFGKFALLGGALIVAGVYLMVFQD